MRFFRSYDIHPVTFNHSLVNKGANYAVLEVFADTEYVIGL